SGHRSVRNERYVAAVGQVNARVLAEARLPHREPRLGCIAIVALAVERVIQNCRAASQQNRGQRDRRQRDGQQQNENQRGTTAIRPPIPQQRCARHVHSPRDAHGTVTAPADRMGEFDGEQSWATTPYSQLPDGGSMSSYVYVADDAATLVTTSCQFTSPTARR